MLIKLKSLVSGRGLNQCQKNILSAKKLAAPVIYGLFLSIQRCRESNYGHTIKNDNRRLYEKRIWEIQGGQAGFETPEGGVGAIFFRV